MEPRKQSTDSLLRIVNSCSLQDTCDSPNGNGRDTHNQKTQKKTNNTRHVRLSPILTVTPSPASPRLYEHKRSPALRDRVILANEDVSGEDSSNITKLDSVKKPDRLPSFGNSKSSGGPTLRDMFSPIPRPDILEDSTKVSSSFSFSKNHGQDKPVSLPVAPKLSKTERRASDIVFPTIKVDSYCEDSTDFAGRAFSNEKRAQSSSDFTSTFMDQEECVTRDRDRGKCLMVPPTLVRTRSTDGRLMMGIKDRNAFPDFPTISKAWSKSEGNLFSGRAGVERLRSQLATTSKSNEIKPENSEFQFDEFIGAKTYKKLDPIRSKPAFQADPSSKLGLDSTDVLLPSGGKQKFRKEIESESEDMRQMLCGSGIPNDVIAHKPRSKSFSPRRDFQLGGETFLADAKTSEFHDKQDGGKDGAQAEMFGNKARFLSPQPRRRLAPLYGDRRDL